MEERRGEGRTNHSFLGYSGMDNGLYRLSKLRIMTILYIEGSVIHIEVSRYFLIDWDFENFLFVWATYDSDTGHPWS